MEHDLLFGVAVTLVGTLLEIRVRHFGIRLGHNMNKVDILAYFSVSDSQTAGNSTRSPEYEGTPIGRGLLDIKVRLPRVYLLASIYIASIAANFDESEL
jgi:hypothetical protein